MGNRKNISDRLSASNQYYSKRKRKRLGPIGKVLLAVIAILVVSIVIYEVNSPTSPNNQPLIVNTPATPILSEEEQLKQQYQELLKSGQKYTETKRADSIKQAALKILEEEKNNPTTQRPPAITSSTPPASSSSNEPQRSSVANTNPSTNSNNNSTSTTAVTSTPIAANASPSSGNEPVEEVYYPAQSISGTITSAADGSRLSGVNVMVKGSSQSTVSDYNGAYSIDMAAGPAPRVLQFNYQGNRIERNVRPGRNTIDAKF